MSTLWANGDRGLKIDLWATKLWPALFNLKQEFYPAQPSSSRKNSLSQLIFTILLHSRWTNVHFMGKWRHGLKIDLLGNKILTQLAALFNFATQTNEFYLNFELNHHYSLTSNEEFSSPTILQGKICLVNNFASFQVNKCPLYGQMERGA